MNVVEVIRHFVDDLGMMGVGSVVGAATKDRYYSYVKSVWIEERPRGCRCGTEPREHLCTLGVTISSESFECAVWKVAGNAIPYRNQQRAKYYFTDPDAMDKVEQFLKTGQL